MAAISSSPVHRLPPEVLSDIFRASGDGQSDRYSRHDGAPPLARLSHVCTKWRQVLLEMQDIWSAWPRYRTVDENWTLLCCARANTAPLDLHWYIGWATADDRSENVISRVRHTLPHASRARTLRIELCLGYEPGPLAFWRDEASPALSVPFPLLEDFAYKPGPEVSHEDMRKLKSTIFGGVCPPRLHTLFLSNCEALQSCPIYSANLQHLSLFNTRAWTNVDSMIQLFQSIPNLETFDYSHSKLFQEQYDYTPSQRHPLRAVPMNRLKSFATTDSSFVLGITVFCYLALPRTASISFWWNVYEEEVVDVNQLSQALDYMRLGAQALDQHFTAALSDGMEPFSAVEIAGDTVRPFYRDGEDDRVSLNLMPPFMGSLDMCSRDESSLFAALQPIFLQATYLRLKLSVLNDIMDGYRIWDALWMNLYRYSKVTSLHLFGRNVVWFLIHMKKRLDSVVTALPPLFPVLKTITISDFDFVRTKLRLRRVKSSPTMAQILGDVMYRTYSSSETFDRVLVGTTCNGHEAAVKQLKRCIGNDCAEIDEKA